MKILNFLPLLVWSLGLLAFPTKTEHRDMFALFYFAGCIFWLLVALVCF